MKGSYGSLRIRLVDDIEYFDEEDEQMADLPPLIDIPSGMALLDLYSGAFNSLGKEPIEAIIERLDRARRIERGGS
jgi:hypothetical protein